MRRLLAAGVMALFGGLAAADDARAVTITIVDTEIEAAPNQVIEVLVSGGEAITGIDLRVLIGDGGASVGGLDPEVLVGMDVEGAGLVFGANNDGSAAASIFGNFGEIGTSTNSGTVVASGILARLIVDGTLFTGPLTFRFFDAGGDFSALGAFASTYNTPGLSGLDIISQPITISVRSEVPEPSTALLVAGAAGLTLRRVARRTR